MGRKVRKVPAGWEHPKNDNGYYMPLFDRLGNAVADFQKSIDERGLLGALEWHGGGPNPEDYMPDWPEDERTHFIMYEDTTEGTPISPAFATAEELARWLADTGASSFANMTATYEQWLPICQGGFAPSMVISDTRVMSGVEAATEL